MLAQKLTQICIVVMSFNSVAFRAGIGRSTLYQVRSEGSLAQQCVGDVQALIHEDLVEHRDEAVAYYLSLFFRVYRAIQLRARAICVVLNKINSSSINEKFTQFYKVEKCSQQTVGKVSIKTKINKEKDF